MSRFDKFRAENKPLNFEAGEAAKKCHKKHRTLKNQSAMFFTFRYHHQSTVQFPVLVHKAYAVGRVQQ